MIGRIQDRRTFDRLRHDGVRVRIEPLWCSFVPDATATPTRVAFAIGRATGNAVKRNRLRRRLREILSLAATPAGLLLVGAKPAATELTFVELRQRVEQLVAAIDRVAPA